MAQVTGAAEAAADDQGDKVDREIGPLGGRTPEQWAEYWTGEFARSRRDKHQEKWRRDAAKIDREFRAEVTRDEADPMRPLSALPVFSANVITQRAILYGQTPRATVSRRFADANDDVARVAAEALERIINTDIERYSDGYRTAVAHALSDRQLGGWGEARVRYVVETERRAVEAQTAADGEVIADGFEEEVKSFEDVEVDYVHWEDQLWSPARIWHEVRWWAHSSKMSREQLRKRFTERLPSGKTVGEVVPLTSKPLSKREDDPSDGEADVSRAEVWEVWDKEHGLTFWVAEGFPRTLDIAEAMYGLDGFFPCPPPMVANPTTSRLVPRPDWAYLQDLYREVDTLTSRVKLLSDAVSASGSYDKALGDDFGRMLTAGVNHFVPVDGWAMFAEKGGIRGHVEFLPLDAVVAAMTVLVERRRDTLDLIFQLSGMSDIMRGQATQAGATATEQRAKTRFASVRMNAMQMEFAEFCSNLLRLKAQLIARFFSPETIIERSNLLHTPDAQYAQAAVDLIKNKPWALRIEVKPEALSLVDFSALKDERTEVLTAVGGFLSIIGPLVQVLGPGALPHQIGVLKWMVAGLKGASSIEGVLDQWMAQAEEAAQQAASNPQGPPPDPKLLVAQVKGQADLAKIQAETQARLTELQAEVESDRQREANQAQANLQEHTSKLLVTRALTPPKPPSGGPRGAGGGGKAS